MDRRTLLAIGLCFLIFLGWQELYLKPIMKQREAYQAQQQQSSQQTASTATPGAMTSSSGISNATLSAVKSNQQRALERQELPVENGTVTLTNDPQAFAEWDLRDYVLGIPEVVGFWEHVKKLVAGRQNEKLAPTVGDLEAVTNEKGEMEIAFNSPDLAYLSAVRGELRKTDQGYLWSYEDDRIRLSREILPVPGQPYLNVHVQAQFKGAPAQYAFVSLSSSSPQNDPHSRDRQLVYWTKDSVQRVHVGAGSVDLKEVQTPVKWIAASNRYFLMTLVPQGSEPKALIQPTGERSARLSLVYPVAGQTLDTSFRAYFGPQKLEILKQVDPTLDHFVNFGFFSMIGYPLLMLLKFFQRLVSNWGVAIILLTLVVRALVAPLAFKSAKSMKKMAVIQPQLNKLKEKYKDDKEGLNREMLTLMKGSGYNPMAGCLPLLVQMPIFFALYQVLYSAIELYQAPFAFWIKDLSEKDPFFVTPILMTVTMFFQMKLTPVQNADPVQAKMMQWMPVMFGVFMLTLPSGLTIYMLVSTLFGIAQQRILNKRLGIGPQALVPANA